MTLFESTGLSPRVRGNRHAIVDAGKAIRSIPARAGEPRCQDPIDRAGATGVYPRACGGTKEQLGITVAREGLSPPCGGTLRWRRGQADLGGLSPRVRGNPVSTQHRQTQQRSIPARAGEPMLSIAQLRLHAVYPRACGGTHLLRQSPLS